MTRSDFRLLDPLRVRWAEVDMQRIVFNGHYLMYADTAVAAYWRALAMPYHETMGALGGDLYVRKATVEYLGSARYDDQLDVGVRMQPFNYTGKKMLGVAAYKKRAQQEVARVARLKNKPWGAFDVAEAAKLEGGHRVLDKRATTAVGTGARCRCEDPHLSSIEHPAVVADGSEEAKLGRRHVRRDLPRVDRVDPGGR